MKAKRILLIVGLYGVLQTVVSAQPTNASPSGSESKTQMKPVYPEIEYKVEAKKLEPPTTAPSDMNVSASASKTQMKPVYPVTQYKVEAKKTETATPAASEKIERYGSTESSQAWTTIATKPSNPTVFHDASTHEPQLCLLSFGKRNGHNVQLGK